MASELLTTFDTSNNRPKLKASSGLTIDFTAVRIGASNLTISESTGDFDMGGNDITNLNLAASPTNYSTAGATVREHLAGIDSALGTAANNEFVDNVFRINDDGDATKQIAFQASSITTSTVRTITMADANIDLDDLIQIYTLAGVSQGANGLGTFTGSIISDNTSIKNALQQLETDLELQMATLDLASNANGLGASLVGIEDASSQFTGTTVEAALDEALDAAQAAQADIDSHVDGSASKHDATEIDYERSDGSKQDIQAASDDVETALTDLDDNKISKTGSIAFTGNQSMGSNKITNLADGTAASDAINKGQLDAAVSGLSWKEPVRLKSNANIVSLTGITASDFDGTGQGVTLVSGDRVLLGNDQTTASQRGIYEYDGADLVRSSDFDSAGEAEAATVFVQEGTDADKGYTQTADSVTIDTTGQSWVQFFGGSALSAGDGIDISSGVVSVDLKASAGLKFDATELAVEPADIVDNSTLEDNGSDQIRIKDDGVTGAKLAPAVAGSGLVQDGSGNLDVNVDNSTIEISTDTVQLKDDGVTGAKLAPAVAGSGLVQDGSGNLDVNVDGSTIEISTDTLQLKDDGVTGAKLAPAVAGSGLVQDGSGNLDVNVDGSTIEISTDTLQLKDDGVTGAKLAPAVAGAALVQDGSGNLDVNVDGSSIEISADALQVKADGIVATMINSDVAGLGLQQATDGSLEKDDVKTFQNDDAAAFAAGEFGVVEADGNVVKVRADSSLNLGSNIVMALESINSAASGKFAVSNFKQGGFSTLSEESPIYVSRGTAGALTQSLSGFVAGEHIVSLGMVNSASEIHFQPRYIAEF